MALHLNLYHEIQKQDLQRRRDPLKLGVYGVVVVIFALAAYYFYRMDQVRIVSGSAKRLQVQWQMAEPKAKDAQLLESQLTTTIKTKEDLVQAIESRFYWAPLLERIQQSVPGNVQIITFRGAMDGGNKKGVLNISGVAAGVEPRKVAEDFRTNFVAKCLAKYKDVDSKFSALEESETTVQFEGKSLNSALFSLQFQFTVEEANPSPSPVQRVPKGAR